MVAKETRMSLRGKQQTTRARALCSFTSDLYMARATNLLRMLQEEE
jgi:hypothetical protein